MNEPNRRAKIPQILTEDGRCLESIDIPIKEESPDFFDQKFYCAGKDPQGISCLAAASAKTKHSRENQNGTSSTVSGNFYLAQGAAHIYQCGYDIMAQLHALHTTYQDTLEKVDNHYLLTVHRRINKATSATTEEERGSYSRGTNSTYNQKRRTW